jgi:NTE family protein
MLRELMQAGVRADPVLGSSVGAMSLAFFARAPHAAGVNKLEEVWRGLRRHDVFPLTFRSVLRFMGGADNLIDPSNLRKLIERNIPFPNLEDAPIPAHIAPRILAAPLYACRRGPTVEAPRQRRNCGGVPIGHVGKHHLIDGAVGSNTQILHDIG